MQINKVDQHSEQSDISRRGFLKASSLAGGGLVLGFFVPGSTKLALAEVVKSTYAPNAFLRIAPDNTITVSVNRLEFGQGITTGFAMLIAEELDADWSSMRTQLAPAGEVYKDPVNGLQMTGGSSSTKNSYLQYRQIGAAARTMLIAAAAKQWKVAADKCSTNNNWVIGPSGRKASYGSLADAAMKVDLPVQVTLKDPKQFKLIGKPTPRIDSRAKTTGAQQFGIDFKLPKTKVALIARAPTFGGTVASYDAKKALAIKGVHDVVEVKTDRGGTGVAVIADGYWPAKQGRDALVVKWNSNKLPEVSTEKQFATYKKLAKTPGTVAVEADVSGLANAAKKISAEYEFPYLAHAPMEPLNCVVALTKSACTVWAGSQFQTVDHAAIAHTAGLKPEQVTLNTMTAGGGFGRRAVPTSDYIVEAVNVAKAYHTLGNVDPIKVMWSREDDIKGGYYRPAFLHHAEIGFDNQGKMVGWNHTIVGQSILEGTPFEKRMLESGLDNTMFEGMRGTYNVPLKVSVHRVKVNVPVLWWRSVGSTHTAFVEETLIDEAAHLTGKDPVAYRKTLMGKDHPRHLAALELAVKISGYGKNKLPKGHAFGVALHESFNSVVAYVVEASVVDGVPKLHKVWAGVHCNQPVNPLTIEAQVQGSALMALGTTLPGAAITLKDSVVQQSNFNDYTVARMPDMPLVTVAVVPSNDPPTGMGEPGLPPLAPAFANAIFNVTGKRLRKLPFDLAKA
jgi:isoquinoline 1-oxidoreductase beta subunit